MSVKDVVDIAVKVDRQLLEARLCDLSIIAQANRSDRVGVMAAVLSKLHPGAYLLGCGPYTCGIVPLSVTKVVLGRPPSPLEEIPDSVVDFMINDAVWMVPREASRIHASILRQTTGGTTRYWIRDEDSSAGTYVNSRQVGLDENGEIANAAVELKNGDIISLGPSGVNSYVFFVCEPSAD